MSLYGIDVSNWQAGLDLSKVRCDFVIVKATEGLSIVDKSCDKFFQQAKALGKKLGFYHFARPEYNSAEAEAEFFYKHTKGYFGLAIPVLDWESNGRANTAWALRWLKRVEELSGAKPMIYMNQSTCQSYDWSQVVANDNGLWIAKYRDMQPDYNHDMSNAGSKPVIKYWPFYAMWQWTSTGRLDGYGGDLDCDVFYGDKATWDKYAALKTAQSTDSTPAAPSAGNTGYGLVYDRAKMVNQAKAWLGKKESDGSFRDIIDLYNSHRPLPNGYRMSYTDPWCAAFIGALAVKCGLTNIIPMSASVPDMVNRAKAMGIWVEADNYKPQSADLVVYDWDDNGIGDNTGNPDHVGLIVEVGEQLFRTIEGNLSDAVGKRTMSINGKYIRGFITPKYGPIGSDEPDENGQYTATVIFEDEPHNKTVDQLAQEVLEGKWGNGQERRERLTNAGYSYAAVQAKVNDLVFDQIAREVIAGKWGNGWIRRRMLQEAGYNYNVIQSRVNKMLRK